MASECGLRGLDRDADSSSRWTLLFPLVVPPTSNGWSYLKRSLPSDHAHPPGLHAPELADGLVAADGSAHGAKGANGAEHGQGGKYVMGDDGSLTDDEEGGGGFWE